MAETVITVHGSFDSYHPPERATVTVVVGHQGAGKQDVYAQTTKSAAGVTQLLGPITDPDRGPVTWWSSDRLRTWSEKPWNQEGKQLPLVFHAAVGVEAKFRDFDALARFLDEITVLPGVSVNGIAWTLTAVRQREVVREARQRAVRDAREKAEDYAAAAGLHNVAPIAVADVGMLGDGVTYSTSGGGMAFARAAAMSGGASEGSIDLTPSDVTISAAVDARFVAT